MKKIVLAGVMICALFLGPAFAAEDTPSLGTQAGTTAKQLKENVDQTVQTGSQKVTEAEKQVQAQAQTLSQNLRQQWDQFSKQAQIKLQELQRQMQKQWQDFNASFNKK